MMFSSNAFRFVLVLAAACNTAVTSATNEVDLGTAENYAILTKTGITNAGASITGDIAVSPIAETAMTGFGFAMDPSGTFSTSSLLTGNAYAANRAAPTPSVLTTAVSDMELAYADAARAHDGAVTMTTGALGGGALGGTSNPITAGVYNFNTDVLIGENIHFTGSATDVFIIQTTGDLLQAADKLVILDGAVVASNIFWSVAGKVVVGASAHLEGTLLVKTDVTFKTSSSLNGRVLAQTACVLQDASTITVVA
jgi:hypothetical protein